MGRAIVTLDLKLLGDFLRVPIGCEFIAAFPPGPSQISDRSIDLLVSSPEIPETPKGHMLPKADMVTTERRTEIKIG